MEERDSCFETITDIKAFLLYTAALINVYVQCIVCTGISPGES